MMIQTNHYQSSSQRKSSWLIKKLFTKSKRDHLIGWSEHANNKNEGEEDQSLHLSTLFIKSNVKFIFTPMNDNETEFLRSNYDVEMLSLNINTIVPWWSRAMFVNSKQFKLMFVYLDMLLFHGLEIY